MVLEPRCLFKAAIMMYELLCSLLLKLDIRAIIRPHFYSTVPCRRIGICKNNTSLNVGKLPNNS